jgi:serine/threonine protein kinase
MRKRAKRDGGGGMAPRARRVCYRRYVVDALGHAHGGVHRDIKPDDALIWGQHAVVTDFGVGHQRIAMLLGER